MKKALAIVLALVMVLCMIPALSAETYTTKSVADKNYTLKVMSVGTPSGDSAKAEKANSITFKYNYEKEDADATGKWTENAKMALVVVEDFDKDLGVGCEITSVTVDGKKLAETVAGVGYNKNDRSLAFPVELTKAGYTDSYVIQVTGKAVLDGVETIITETAKISVKLVNTAAYKDAKTATIIDVASDKKVVDAYIVGSKLYLDYVKGASGTTIDLTFADENGKKFSAITYASQPSSKKAICLDYVTVDDQQKLVNSTAKYYVNGLEDKGVVFGLETAGALYETKKYDIVVRTGIVEENPKGIYFAENTKTIAVGESFKPVVLSVATNKRVDADIYIGYDAKGTYFDYPVDVEGISGGLGLTDTQVIDVEDKKTVIGVREGVAFISAVYEPIHGDKYTAIYAASAMKIIVTAGPSIPPVVKTDIYYVTCRNLNVRKGAGTSYAKAGMIHRGDAVEVVEIKGGWAKLANGTYVCAKYIAK